MTPIHFPPDVAALAFTAGLAGIGFECNRPGMILPGCTGLLTVLLAAASLYRASAALLPALALALCLAALLVNTRRRLGWGTGTAVTLACIGAWRLLIPPPRAIDWLVASLCGLSIGALGWFLTGLALQARQAKALPKAIN